MTAGELLQYMNLLLVPIGCYVVVLERRMAKFELLAEQSVKENQRRDGAILAAHIRLDRVNAPPAGAVME